jgi:hypothetical protein
MQQQQQQSETIEVSFEFFRAAVSRHVESLCGLGLDDIEDFDVYDYYPGESAYKADYQAGVKDAAAAAVENAIGFNVVED